MDSDPPQISVTSGITALGLNPSPFAVKVSEQGSGISSLRAFLKTHGKEKPCEVQVGPATAELSAFSVTCDARSLNAAPGAATIKLIATDRSLRGNQGVREFPVNIDFTPPQIEILTLQHAMQGGGAEMVLFRVHDDLPITAEVRIGSARFGASPARAVDPAFPENANTYVSVFAVPVDFDPSKLSTSDRARVRAEDHAGNAAEAELRFRFEAVRMRTNTITLDDEFIELRVQPLVRSYELFLRRTQPAGADEKIRAFPAPDEGAARFAIVNKDYRQALNQSLNELFSKVTPERLWQGVFIRPMAGSLSANFAERRTYLYKGEEVGTSVHEGFDMASTERAVVRASNEGIVRLAEDFGIYGNTIVVDHGLGVFTLYSHLSVMQVSLGDRVLKGDIIGRTGTTGFAAGDHLHFELRVGTVPVTPIEWWDPKWYADNIELKISDAKARL
jgi:murein DD-endopeptidase MepM/ murein hydrolase activator NlpD